jgi:hypothetical protein
MDDPAVRPVIQAMEQTLAAQATAGQSKGSAVIKMPLLGGSVPMYLFTDVLKTPVVGLPIVNHDNNQQDLCRNPGRGGEELEVGGNVRIACLVFFEFSCPLLRACVN